MSETYTVSAKTVDEAIDLASKLYGGKNKEISHDILSLPKKGFLGFGSKDAVIRVTVTDTEDDGLSSIVNEIKSYKTQGAPETGYYTDEEAPAAKKPEQKRSESKKNAQSKDSKPKAEQRQTQSKKPAQEEKAEKAENTSVAEQSAKVQKSEKSGQKKQKKSAPAEKSAKPEKAEKTEKVQRDALRTDDVKIKAAVSDDEMKFAIEFIDAMIANMKLSASAVPVSAPEGEEYTMTETETVYPAVDIVGDDTGILIGHHGETLDAIQYLVNLALFRRSNAEKGGRENIKITVDIENYRAKREETLRALARRMAARAVKYKRNVFLEPMNPYERRIIHSELQTYPDVSTHSVGSDTNRKIIITYEGADKAYGNNKRRGRNNRRGGNNAQSAGAVRETAVPQGLPLPTLDDIDE